MGVVKVSKYTSKKRGKDGKFIYTYADKKGKTTSSSKKEWMEAVVPYAKKYTDKGIGIEEAIKRGAADYQATMKEMSEGKTDRSKKKRAELAGEVYSTIKQQSLKVAAKNEEKFSIDMISKLKAEYSKLGDRVDPESPAMKKMWDSLMGMSDTQLEQLSGAGIKWLSRRAVTALAVRSDKTDKQRSKLKVVKSLIVMSATVAKKLGY